MANYVATARSNYFRVKNPVAFREWAESRLLDVQGDNEKGFMIYPSDYAEGSWPSSVYDDDSGDYTDIDLPGELAEHLADDYVAILEEVGHEKLRYLLGWAVAVNNKGGREHVDLSTLIGEKAKKLGKNIGALEY